MVCQGAAWYFAGEIGKRSGPLMFSTMSFDGPLRRALALATVVAVAALGAVAYRHHQAAKKPNHREELRKAYFELRLNETLNGPGAPQTTAALNNLALLDEAQDRYELAQQLLERAWIADKNRTDAAGPSAQVRDLRNLAKLSLNRGRFSEAEPLLRDALEIERKMMGQNDPAMAPLAMDLAMVYARKGDDAKAEELFRQGIKIVESGARGTNDPALIQPLNSLGYLFLKRSDYVKARAYFEQALAVARRNARSRDDALLVRPLLGLGLCAHLENKYAEAEKYYLRALKTAEARLGKEDFAYLRCNFRLATLFYSRGDWKSAGKYFEASRAILQEKLTSHFPYMGERDKLVVLAKVREVFSAYESFCMTYAAKHPELAGKMYDLLLTQKGLVVSSNAALRREVVASGEPRAIEMWEGLARKKEQVAQLENAPPKERERAEREADQLEEELAAHVSWTRENESKNKYHAFVLAREREELRATPHWQDVRARLQPGEATIEYLHFPFHDGKKLTGTHYYVALVIGRTSTTGPKLVRLCDESELKAPMSDYAVRTGQSTGERGKPNFYQVFWKPLEPELRKAKAKRVYISPDGILNVVSFGVVSDETGPPLLETYDLRTVSSTRDVLAQEKPPSGKLAVLIGNPRFDLEPSDQLSVVHAVYHEIGEPEPPSPGGGARPGWMTGSPLAELAGTKTELDAAGTVLGSAGWTVKVYPEERALVEVVKRVHGPRLLMVATHGEYQPARDEELKESELVTQLSLDQSAGLEDPMLGSVLYFAGANRVKKGLPKPDGMDDGVLTAYEATELDLQGTELVVLSACQSGLGKTTDGEGVFGLRRALQEAGSEAVMMSMWKLPDEKTAKLMKIFFSKWVQESDKYKALREAQLTIRKEVMEENLGHDMVHLWGGLVLVGRGKN
jgi:CHAT domain-containing protein/Tfp pilus assembly protein PilF